MVWWSQGKDEKNKDELQTFFKSFGLKTPQKYRFILVKSPSIQKLARHFLNKLSGFPVYLRNFFLSMKTFYLKEMKTKVRLLHVHVSVFQAVKVPG